MKDSKARQGKAPIRWLAPALIATLSLLFIALVGYQVTQRKDTGAATDVSPVAAKEQPATNQETAAESDAKQASSTDAVGAQPQFTPSQQAVRNKILDFFSRMPADLSQLENPLSIVQTRKDLEDYLAGLSPDMVPVLLDLLHKEKDFVNRRFLLRALGNIGSDEAAQGLADYYMGLADAHPGGLDPANEIKYTIEALGKVDSDYSYRLLSEFAEGKGRPHDQYRFVEALGDHPRSADAVPIFTKLLDAQQAPYFQVRVRAADALKKADVIRSSLDLQRALETETNPIVRQAMMGALGALGNVNSLPTLEQIATEDKDHVNRMSAVSAISRIGGTSAKDILLKIAENDSNERVRSDARRAVEKLEAQGF